MNSSIAGIRSVQPTQNRETTAAVGVERRRIDVTGLPADRVAEYLQAAGDGDDVYFERRAGKTYVVAPDKQ